MSFVSNDLHKIGKQLSSATSEPLPEDTANNDADTIEEQNQNSAPTDKTLKKAFQKRYDEFVRARRDINARIAEALAVIPIELESYDSRFQELHKAKEKYEAMLEKLEDLDEASYASGDISALGAGMKQVEGVRIESLVLAARLEKLTSGFGEGMAPHGRNGESLLHELTSLSFMQLLKLGFGVSLPIICAITVAALLIGGILIILMG